MKKIELNNGWRLHASALLRTKEHLMFVKEEIDNWYTCSLPADVHMPLIENGVIKDPVIADYCHQSEWIEKRSWWFFKSFDFEGSHENYSSIELFIESIDTDGDIFINDVYIGSHQNVHRPFIKDVKEFLKIGKNEIAVRVTTGLEKITDQDLSENNFVVINEYDNGRPDRGDPRRSFVRRPQYTVGWDWGPRVVTCGITGNAEIRLHKGLAIRELSIATKSIEIDVAVIEVTANIESFDMFATSEFDASFEICFDGVKVSSKTIKRELLISGYNYLTFNLEVENPKLWWPNGYGSQPLYDINFSVFHKNNEIKYKDFKFGIRTVKLDLSPIDQKQRRFVMVVNDIPIFCKGGNWIPGDSIYARVTDEKYKTLIVEALNANFNTLRIWGGGVFERDSFYNLCDQYGIILWHDFMFACSTYPDHRKSFKEECRLEIDYQTKRLRNHPSICLWCGNNENHAMYHVGTTHNYWNLSYTYERQYGMNISNIIAREVVKLNCNDIPYWNSSPYGGEVPNCEDEGDVHYWSDAMMSPDMEKRVNPVIFDKLNAKFVSEYGYIGSCSIRTISDYFDGNPIDRDGDIWKLHTNSYEKDTVEAGIEKHYNVDAKGLDLEGYIFYSGAVQSLYLGYSLEALRFKDFCGGAIFWMYNDTWGEVGWTIIDYYMRRKIGFYGVKRAFQPIKLSARVFDGEFIVQGCNDTNQFVKTDAQIGYISFDGKIKELNEFKICLAPHIREYIYKQAIPDYDYTKGTLAVIPDHSIEPIALRTTEYRQLDMPMAHVKITSCIQEGENVRIILVSDSYAHFVHICKEYNSTDNYFDLLPSIAKEVTVFNVKTENIEINWINRN